MLIPVCARVDRRPHAVFWDVRKLLTQELVRQAYLDVQKQPGSEPPAYEYRWGQRAKHEVSKRKCLSFITEVRHSYLFVVKIGSFDEQIVLFRFY